MKLMETVIYNKICQLGQIHLFSQSTGIKHNHCYEVKDKLRESSRIKKGIKYQFIYDKNNQ